MILESTKTNIDVSSVLEEILTTETVNYVERVVSLNHATEDRIALFLKELTGEFTLMCSIRKFTILNTNVVRGNQARILENDTLRSFYFELFKSVMFRLDLDYSSKDKITILKALVETSKMVPCIDNNGPGKKNPLILNDQDFKNLCGTVYVDNKVIDEFLGMNEWYLVVILTNIYATKLLENIKVLSTVK